MKMILEYVLDNLTDVNGLLMPIDSKFLAICSDSLGLPVIVVLSDPASGFTAFQFAFVKTGDSCPHSVDNYLGTFSDKSGETFHVFQIRTKPGLDLPLRKPAGIALKEFMP